MLHKRLDFIPKGLRKKSTAQGLAAWPKAKRLTSTLMILDIHELFPNLEIFGFSPLRWQWIFLKKRNDDMVKVGRTPNLILDCRGRLTPCFLVMNITHAKHLMDVFKSWTVIGSNANREAQPQLFISTLAVMIDDSQETSFPRYIPSQPNPELIRYFQIESKPFLHRSLLNVRPTNPFSVLPGYTANGHRIDGPTIQTQNRLPCSHVQDTTKRNSCQ